MGRQLFLHHYLPAHLASSLVVGALTQFLFSRGFDGPVSPGVVTGGPSSRPTSAGKPSLLPGAPRSPGKMAVQRPRPHDQTVLRVVGGMMVISMAAGFLFFAPLTYGEPGCSVERLAAMKWLDTWDFHFTK
jgi:dolichyl-phosphate-mannose-protein mannosyltransferase